MAFSRELLRGLAAELVRLGISLFGEKPLTCPEGADPLHLVDKSAYWESEARSCREDLRGFTRCEGLLESCQIQLRFVTAWVIWGILLGFLAGLFAGSWGKGFIVTWIGKGPQTVAPGPSSEGRLREAEEVTETGKDELASARSRARMLRG